MIEQASGSIQSALHSGLQGYQQGSNSMSNAGRELAGAFSGSQSSVDVNRTAVDLSAGLVQAQASAEVISRADSMLGTIIDTFA